MSILETISLDNEVFRAYAFWTAITCIKMLLMSGLTGKARFKNKVNWFKNRLNTDNYNPV